jgi:phosphoribosyl 1,2-cyclic phosphate phosphodiesterase
MEGQFLLLGSGTSAGVPIPGCSCSVCTSRDPRNWRNRTSAYLRLASGISILIDATPDLRHQCLQHGVGHVDAVLFTHCHADHICGTDDLRVFNFHSGKALDCFGTPETFSGIRRMFPYIFDRDPAYQGAPPALLTLHEISNFEPFSFGGVKIQPFPLPHGNTTVTGFRVGSMAYATDCKGLSPRAEEVLEDIDVLFLDGIRYEPHRTHNSIDEAIYLARKVKAKQTYLIHLTHAIDHAEVSAKLPPGVALGYDGLTVDFRG